ncbi:MAG: GspE/PulE family protein [Thermodesulfobacteriota bacterium]
MAVSRASSFSVENVCQILAGMGIISQSQSEKILLNKDRVQQKLEKERRNRQAHLPEGRRIENPVTSIDIIACLNLRRADDPEKHVDEETLYQLLAETWDVPYQKIDPLKLDLNTVTTTIPRSFAMKHLVLPVAVQDGCLTIATSDPFNLEAFDDITRVSQLKVRVVLSSKSDIITLIDEFFGFKRSIAAAEMEFGSMGPDLGNLEQYVRLHSVDELPSNDRHIVNAVNHLFSYAIDQRASDIHIEPKRDVSLVRMRIDGILHTVYKLPKKVHLAIVSRIKNLSRLDMSEKRRPQDGRIKTDKGGVEVEVRISTVPVAFGEKVVMRIMDPDILFQDLKKLGFSDHDYSRFSRFVQMPHGIVLVCGPTGSGKSTTLYSAMRGLSSPEINIVTVEDPIEMIHEDFNQIAVQPAVDITFDSILRTILRQDPDVIMIGEMRDLPTAQNAVQAALTGHLVLSSLHTNDAPSAVTRMLDLGVPHFLIQATLIGVLGQRLVRKICPYCKEVFGMEPSALMDLGITIPGKKSVISLSRGNGCIRCRGTGYLGRIGIFEVLPYSEEIRRLTTNQTDLEVIRKAARREGMKTLREDAVEKMLDGLTTYQEVLRVTWEAA